MEYHMRPEPYQGVIIPGFPPESTAPPIEAGDRDYDPYAKEVVLDAAV